MKLDLHIHTNCSDGSDDWETILQKAEQLGLEVISITDHNNVDVYFQMQDPEKYFSGKIIKGIEPECIYRGRLIELLGYGIDVEKMRTLLAGLYLPIDDVYRLLLKNVHEICTQGGMRFSADVLNTWDKKKCYYPVHHLHADIKKNPENRKIITDDESWNNGVQFYRNYISNPESRFYVDETSFYPSAENIYHLIKQAEGKVFIPHPFAHGNDSISVVENLLKDFQIDGIECFYNSHTKEQTDFLLNFCKKHKLLVCAGSDYHGSPRPHVKLGVENARLRNLTKWLRKL